MATAIPLPLHRDLPDLVIFHREHPADPVLLMQMPKNSERTEFETYYVKLDNETHKEWLSRLPHSRDLLDKLGYEEHVAFCPQTGHLQPMPDIDAPNATQIAVATARAFGASRSPLDEAFDRRKRVERFAPAPISRLRQSLMGPEKHYGRGGMIR